MLAASKHCAMLANKNTHFGKCQLRLVFMLGLSLVAAYQPASVPDNLRVRLRLYLPSSIELQFDKNTYTEPVSLTLAGIGSDASQSFEFQSAKFTIYTLFKPAVVLRLQTNDVLQFSYVYKDENSINRNVNFEYTIDENIIDDVIKLEPIMPLSTTHTNAGQTDINNNDDAEDLATTEHYSPDESLADVLSKKLKNARLLYLETKSSLNASNAVEAARDFIVNRLKLYQLEYHILQAQFKDEDGILLEMTDRKEALEVLKYANLLNLTNKIEPTERDFFEPKIDVRFL